MRFAGAILAVALGAALPAGAEDLTVVFKVTSGDKTTGATDYFSRTKVRFSDGRNDTLFDTAAGRIVGIDGERREYWEATLAEIEAAMSKATDQMAKARAQQEQALKNMPPEMRAKMEKMMGAALGGAVSVTKGGAGRKIAGYDTEAYLITIGPARTEVWTTTAIQPAIEPGEMLRLQSLMSPTAKNVGGPMLEEFKKIRGFTLASRTTVNILGKTSQTTKEATEVKRDPVPASVFEVPAGYKKVASPFARAMR